MYEYINDPLVRRLRGAVLAVVASASSVALPAHAESPESMILVPPAALPAIARQSGEAMFLHETVYGQSLLYIEQNQGTKLAILDVTDPGHIRDQGSVSLDAAGPFDFVTSLGLHEELLRFWGSQRAAVLDLSKVTVPTLAPIPGLRIHDVALRLGDGGVAFTSQPALGAQATRDFQVVSPLTAATVPQVFDVKDVRQNISKIDTGTTFLLTGDGLFVIRRPRVEIHKATWELDHVN